MLKCCPNCGGARSERRVMGSGMAFSVCCNHWHWGDGNKPNPVALPGDDIDWVKYTEALKVATLRADVKYLPGDPNIIEWTIEDIQYWYSIQRAFEGPIKEFH